MSRELVVGVSGLALEEADRATRVAVKPIKNLLKNKLNLASDDEAVRRAAAGDLGASGQMEAAPWLEAAAAKEQTCRSDDDVTAVPTMRASGAVVCTSWKPFMCRRQASGEPYSPASAASPSKVISPLLSTSTYSKRT